MNASHMEGAKGAHVEEPHGDQNTTPDMSMTGAGRLAGDGRDGEQKEPEGHPGSWGERLTKQLKEHLHPTMPDDYYTWLIAKRCNDPEAVCGISSNFGGSLEDCNLKSKFEKVVMVYNNYGGSDGKLWRKDFGGKGVGA